MVVGPRRSDATTAAHGIVIARNEGAPAMPPNYPLCVVFELYRRLAKY